MFSLSPVRSATETVQTSRKSSCGPHNTVLSLSEQNQYHTVLQGIHDYCHVTKTNSARTPVIIQKEMHPPRSQGSKLKKKPRGQRDDSEVKGTGYSSKVPGLGSHHL